MSPKDIEREALLEAVWPDDDPEHSANTLKTYVSRLRQKLDDRDGITLHGTIYRLAPGIMVDVPEIAADVRAMRTQRALSPAACSTLEDHLEALGRRTIGRNDGWAWFAPVYQRMADLERDAAICLTNAAFTRNEFLTAVRYARILSTADRTDEQAR
jgi:DNA-binding SARP family transcriptional activator